MQRQIAATTIAAAGGLLCSALLALGAGMAAAQTEYVMKDYDLVNFRFNK